MSSRLRRRSGSRADPPPASRAAGSVDAPLSALGRLARLVLAHRRVVIAVWFVVFLAGGFGASHVSKRLKFDFSLPGQPGLRDRPEDHSASTATAARRPPAIVVVTVPAGQTVAGERAQIAAAFARARAQRAAHTHRRPRDRARRVAFVTHDGRTTYALVFTPLEHSFGAPKAPQQVQRVRGGARCRPGTPVGLTGIQQLASGSSSKGPGVLVETLIGAARRARGAGVRVRLAARVLPLLIAAVSILTTLLVVLGLTYVADVSFIVQFLVSLVGLGVAIDYSLLIVTRWREERAHGRENHDAVVVAMATAGRAVVLSGLTVAIGLVALVVLPVPGLRSVGYGGMLIPLVSTAVALTLLPALLGGIGPRVDWPRVRHETRRQPRLDAVGDAVVRHQWLAAAVAVAILAVLIVPVFSLTTGRDERERAREHRPGPRRLRQRSPPAASQAAC